MPNILDRFLYGPQGPEAWEQAAASKGLGSLRGRGVSQQPADSKAAYDIVPVGVQGRPQYPDTDLDTLQRAYTQNEMVYAAINRKASSAVDPRLLVQDRQSDGTWAEIEGHPMRRLHMRPNPDMDEADFMRAYIVSLDTGGIFYAEIVRNKQTGLPAELHPLDAAKVAPVPGSGPKSVGGIGEYEFKDGTTRVRIPATDILVKRKYNPRSRYYGQSPLAVCMGSVDADSAQTDYVRAFFNNGGVPSGIIKVKAVVDENKANEYKARWMARFSRSWGNQHSVAVMDENSSYERIGANLDELSSEAIRSFTESRVSMVFEVPPLIIYSYVGLLRATYSNLKEAWAGFWDATLTPLFKEYRTWLTWSLLKEFVSEDLIYGERIRLNWDMSQVAWLMDDVTQLQARARDNFRAGGITLNEYRAIIGMAPDPAGDYYLRPGSFQPVALGTPAVAVDPAADTAPAGDTTGTADTGTQNGKAQDVIPDTKLLVSGNGHHNGVI